MTIFYCVSSLICVSMHQKLGNICCKPTRKYKMKDKCQSKKWWFESSPNIFRCIFIASLAWVGWLGRWDLEWQLLCQTNRSVLPFDSTKGRLELTTSNSTMAVNINQQLKIINVQYVVAWLPAFVIYFFFSSSVKLVKLRRFHFKDFIHWPKNWKPETLLVSQS